MLLAKASAARRGDRGDSTRRQPSARPVAEASRRGDGPTRETTAPADTRAVSGDTMTATPVAPASLPSREPLPWPPT